jgi:Tol biopolymer transport system component/DNA-binding winged helix-turn-helix (wHTH) protein
MLHFPPPDRESADRQPSRKPHPRIYRFSHFDLDVGEHRLTKSGSVIPLAPRAFDVLVALVVRAGSLVTKEQLLAEVWKDTAVEEANLAVAVSAIRKVIGAEAIQTVPRRGYRFSATVTPIDERPPGSPPNRAPVRPKKQRFLLATVGGTALSLAFLAAVPYLRRDEPTTRPVGGEVRDHDGRLTRHPGADAHPSWSSDGRIAFSSDRDDGDLEIYAMREDGASPIRLTNSPGRDQDPAWSPDGSTIAFASERGGDGLQVYVMNGDGSDVRRVTALPQSCTMPAWSPDGHRLAFQRTDDPAIGQDIYTVSLGDGQVTRVTHHRAADVSPDWSPDGHWIAFASNRRGDSSNFGIYVVAADGSDSERLLSDARGFDYQPAWSPDGTQLAFASNRNNGLPEIFLMNADGSGQRRLTSPGVTPAWSPDGHELLFASDREGNPEIFRQPLERSQPLTIDAARDAFASWSPDGSSVIFTSNRDGKLALYLMRLPERDITKLTDGAANDWFPAWSPDGYEVVFQSDRAGTGGLNLYVLTLRTRAVRALTQRSGMNASPAWSPDGRKIAFASNSGRHPFNFQITIVDPDGANLHIPRPSKFFDTDPAWSPDSLQLAFTSDRSGSFDVFAMRADGGGLRQLTSAPSNEGSASWSPDGQLIAFASSRGRKPGVHDVYVMARDGTNVMRLTTRTGEWPRWSPAGDVILFLSQRTHDENLFLARLPDDAIAIFRKPLVSLKDLDARRD